MHCSVHRRLLLLVFVLVATAARGQFDVCYTFEEYETVYPHVFPTGWTCTQGAGHMGGLEDAWILSNGHSTPRLLYLNSNNDVYISMPYMNVNFSTGCYLQFWAVQGWNLEVGTMTNPNDPTTFHCIVQTSEGTGYEWVRYVVDLSSAPQGDHYITFHKVGGSYAYIDDLQVTTSGCLMWNFRVVNYENTSDGTLIFRSCDSVLPPVQFTWDALGSPYINVHVYAASSSGSSQEVLSRNFSGVGTLSLSMTEGVQYSISLTVNCSGSSGCGGSSYEEIYEMTVVRPECDSSSCVDTRKLFSTKVIPYNGTCANPYEHVGNITPNTSPDEVGNRHYVCTDPLHADPIVGPQLLIVPPGDDHSVRLGNWNVGAQAEAMLYLIDVDTVDFDMLILKYAAVMEDPGHATEDQPRFRIEMLDDAGNLIAPARCNSYDFVASANLGWNTIIHFGNTVRWKNWTIVGIDLSAYHGQTVRLRLTTFDCDQGAHFGYAYYNLTCAKKTLSFSSCSEGYTNRVEAPEGFNYSWHRDDSDSVIATSRITFLPVDGHTYYCDLSFIGDPTCSVTLSALSRLVWPEADFTYTVSRDNCRFRVDFADLSHLVDDSTVACDYVEWDFGPYGTSTLRNPTVYFSDSGNYTVTLIAGIYGGDCVDTLVRQLRLAYASDTLDTAICADRTIFFGDSLYAAAGIYVNKPTCDSLQVLNLALLDTAVIDTVAEACHHFGYRDSTFLASGVYDFVYTNAVGCDSTHRLHLTVNPEYNLTDTVIICPGRPYVYRGVDYGGPATFDTLLATIAGCDSLVRVTLQLRGEAVTPMAFYSFDGINWADSLPIKGCAPATLHLLDTTPTAVSHLWTLEADTVVSAEGRLTHLLPEPIYDAFATLQLTDSHGCSDTIRWPVYIFPSPEAEFSWLPFHPADVAPEAEFANYTVPSDCHWLWTIANTDGGTDSLTDFAPRYRWQGDLPRGDFDVSLVAYRLYWYDTVRHTCADTVTHTVTIVTAWLEFPNLVTPNGDGVNDRWEVKNLVDLGLYPMNEVWIFNQWGVQVFHAENVRRHEDFWDPNATASPDGTYYFRFLGKSPYGIVRRNGVIEVLR